MSKCRTGLFPARLRGLPLCLGALALLLGVGCTSLPVPPKPPAPDPARLLRQGSVQLEPVMKCVVVTGFVNLVEGPLELMACGPGGKVHESVFVLEVNPVDLQSALLLIGLKPGQPMKELGMGPPLGDRVAIWVRWEQEGRAVIRPLESLALDRKTQRPLKDVGWVFTGSTFANGKFKALAEESLINIYWDPWAILNVAAELGADDEATEANTAALPPLHTPVTLIIQRL